MVKTIKERIPFHLYDAALNAAEPGVTGATTVIRHDNPADNEMLEPFEFEHDGQRYSAWMLWSGNHGVYDIFGDDDARQLKAEARKMEG